MTDQEIRDYCAKRDANPMSWELEEDTVPVFDTTECGERVAAEDV
jgi:hypothetical protein